jgi:endonuclease/exonuclease/phosphatase family metal-dependent hydrolase
MMFKKIFLCFLLLPQLGFSQIRGANVLFWNVENYYDPIVDTLHQDPAFTPQGANHWTWNRFITKRDALAKTIIATGTDELPVVVGLCEVESRFALEQLVRYTPLESIGYRIVHRDGPDERGMDVALLYRPERFRLLLTRFLRVRLPDSTQHTREILYTKGVLDDLDTLHLFVNHWPSKWGGAKASASRRMAAMMRLRLSVDSIFNHNPAANIVIMGDLNDTPLSKVVQALCKGTPLFNLSVPLARRKLGTIRYRGRWELIDQFIVSENLLCTEEPIYTSTAHYTIFSAPFLLIRDEKYLGVKPFRTYLGPRYQGGISDHLPVVLRIERNY